MAVFPALLGPMKATGIAGSIVDCYLSNLNILNISSRVDHLIIFQKDGRRLR